MYKDLRSFGHYKFGFTVAPLDKSQGTEASPAYHKHLRNTLSMAARMRPYHGLRKTLRFVFCAALQPGLYRDWFYLAEHKLPHLPTPSNENDFIYKPTLRYLRRWFRQTDKIRIICYHYTLLNTFFTDAGLQTLKDGLTLATLQGRNQQTYNITLHSHPTKEGELAIHFMDATLNTMLATIRGSFDLDANGQKIFWIGSLQGPPPPFNREHVAAATRDLNALRPKHAVLQALASVCQTMGVHILFAPHKYDHISFGPGRYMLGRQKIHSDYDQFWQDFAATDVTAWGDFTLLLPFARRNPQDVPAKRRKEWTLRYARIEAILESTEAVIHALHRN
ncbi:MAG: DUF535 family protein [Alphaproteobacteria bacterium]|nr:DUF535 family protein [Alphaproteobacteria bacterium]